VETRAATPSLEQYLREHIPLSAAMEVSVVSARPDGVTLSAPLAPNLNHRSTAFGGSVNALATLAGWSIVHLRVRGSGHVARTVIQEGSTSYLRPIHAAFEATVLPIEEDRWERFLRMLVKKGRARIDIPVRVTSAGEEVATFRGRFVVLMGEG